MQARDDEEESSNIEQEVTEQIDLLRSRCDQLEEQVARLLGNEQRASEQLTSQAAAIQALLDVVSRLSAQSTSSASQSAAAGKQSFPGPASMTFSMASTPQPIALGQYAPPPFPSAPSFPAQSHFQPFGSGFSAEQQPGTASSGQSLQSQQTLSSLPGMVNSTQFPAMPPPLFHSSALSLQRFAPMDVTLSSQASWPSATIYQPDATHARNFYQSPTPGRDVIYSFDVKAPTI